MSDRRRSKRPGDPEDLYRQITSKLASRYSQPPRDLFLILNKERSIAKVNYDDMLTLIQEKKYVKIFYPKEKLIGLLLDRFDYYRYHQEVPRMFIKRFQNVVYKLYDKLRRMNYIQAKISMKELVGDPKKLNLLDSDSEVTKKEMVLQSLVEFLPRDLKNSVCERFHNISPFYQSSMLAGRFMERETNDNISRTAFDLLAELLGEGKSKQKSKASHIGNFSKKPSIYCERLSQFDNEVSQLKINSSRIIEGSSSGNRISSMVQKRDLFGKSGQFSTLQPQDNTGSIDQFRELCYLSNEMVNNHGTGTNYVRNRSQVLMSDNLKSDDINKNFWKRPPIIKAKIMSIFAKQSKSSLKDKFTNPQANIFKVLTCDQGNQFGEQDDNHNNSGQEHYESLYDGCRKAKDSRTKCSNKYPESGTSVEYETRMSSPKLLDQRPKIKSASCKNLFIPKIEEKASKTHRTQNSLSKKRKQAFSTNISQSEINRKSLVSPEKGSHKHHTSQKFDNFNINNYNININFPERVKHTPKCLIEDSQYTSKDKKGSSKKVPLSEARHSKSLKSTGGRLTSKSPDRSRFETDRNNYKIVQLKIGQNLDRVFRKPANLLNISNYVVSQAKFTRTEKGSREPRKSQKSTVNPSKGSNQLSPKLSAKNQKISMQNILLSKNNFKTFIEKGQREKFAPRSSVEVKAKVAMQSLSPGGKSRNSMALQGDHPSEKKQKVIIAKKSGSKSRAEPITIQSSQRGRTFDFIQFFHKKASVHDNKVKEMLNNHMATGRKSDIRRSFSHKRIKSQTELFKNI